MAERFMRTAAEHLHVPARALLEDERQALLAYDFPGNVRELQNIIERAMVLEPTGRSALIREIARVPASAPNGSVPPPRPSNGAPQEVLAQSDLKELERQNLLNALAQCSWQIAGPNGAAALLGLSPSTLAYRMKRLNIERPR
jgi:transcriptional regulator with GAF, ATPase, and Fis domain